MSSNMPPPKPMPKPGSPRPKPPMPPKGLRDMGCCRLLCRITRPPPFLLCLCPPIPIGAPISPPKGSAKGSNISSNGSAPPKNSLKMSKGSLKAKLGKPCTWMSSSSQSSGCLLCCLCLPWCPASGFNPSLPYLSYSRRFFSSEST